MTNELNSPVQIEIGATGITPIVKGGDNLVTTTPKVETITTNLSKLEQPPALEPDPPTLSEAKAQLRQLTEKAVLCAMEKLTALLETVKPTAQELSQYMELTIKLLDAKESFEWADAFRAAILKNPKLMSPNGKGLGPKGFQTRTNATILQRLDRGDTRTTPKRLLASMPQDDEQEKAAS